MFVHVVSVTFVLSLCFGMQGVVLGKAVKLPNEDKWFVVVCEVKVDGLAILPSERAAAVAAGGGGGSGSSGGASLNEPKPQVFARMPHMIDALQPNNSTPSSNTNPNANNPVPTHPQLHAPVTTTAVKGRSEVVTFPPAKDKQ